jgi:hypothetical protein
MQLGIGRDTPDGGASNVVGIVDGHAASPQTGSPWGARPDLEE